MHSGGQHAAQLITPAVITGSPYARIFLIVVHFCVIGRFLLYFYILMAHDRVRWSHIGSYWHPN